MNRFQIHSRHLSGLVVAFLVILGSAGASLAQNATPVGAAASHPAHIHEGTCEELNPAPLFPLTDVTAPAATGDMIASPAGSPIAVEISATNLDISLADLGGADHAINIHESADNIESYIACGDIGGALVPDAAGNNQLTVGLHPMDDSGYSGVAVLRDLGGRTEVTIYLIQAAESAAESTPASGHSAHGDAAAAVEVDIVDFAYNPDPITISVGQTVTWTNQDSAPHTVTAQDRALLQSGTLNQGETFTQTFDKPGTYEYFCEFHPNMKGVLIVQ